MSDAKTLNTRSQGQSDLAEKWNEYKAKKAEAERELRQAKLAVPQDKEAINNAKANLAAVNASKKVLRNEEKEFNANEKARIYGKGETKQDTLDKPTKLDSQEFNEQNTEQTGEQNTEQTGEQTDEQTGEQNTEQNTEQTGEQTDEQNTEGTDMSKHSDNIKNAAKDGMKNISKGFQFSDSFYRDMGAAVRGQKTGNHSDVEAATAEAQAQNLRNEAANRQMEAQQSAQIANQNPYAEAGKMASVQNDAENRQNVQKAGTLGSGAALARRTNTPDVQSQMAREDQNRQVASQIREKADIAQQGATEVQGDAEQAKVTSRDVDTDRNEESALTEGKELNPVTETPVETEQTTETETPADTETEQTTEPADTDTETETEQPAPEQQPEPAPSGNPQHVINALLGSSKGQDLRSGNASADQELYNWAINKGVQPLTTHSSKNPNDWEAEFRKLGEPYNEVMDMLRQGRVGEGGDKNKNFSKNEMGNMSDSMTVKQGYACGTDNATPGYHMVGENGPELVKMNGGEKVIPNEVLRFQNMLSDMRMKWIHEDYDRDGRCSPEDFMWLLSQAGKYKHTDDKEYDALNSDDMEESVLKGYADFIRNYVYNYKPEATQIDSRIDPNEEHIGPMAQDIEKVNPACIKETPEGIKTVDTARLAMMNAGAIGDLARQLDELNNKFKALGL